MHISPFLLLTRLDVGRGYIPAARVTYIHYILSGGGFKVPFSTLSSRVYCPFVAITCSGSASLFLSLSLCLDGRTREHRLGDQSNGTLTTDELEGGLTCEKSAR